MDIIKINGKKFKILEYNEISKEIKIEEQIYEAYKKTANWVSVYKITCIVEKGELLDQIAIEFPECLL